MDRIQKSNELLLRTLESVTCVDWLSTTKYSDCCHAVVLASMKKKFEDRDDTFAKSRKAKAIEGIINRNQSTWTDKRSAFHQAGFTSLTLMARARMVMTKWCRGATYSLDDAWCGPGESYNPRRGRTSPLDKFTGILGVTPNAAPLARKFIRRTSYLYDAYHSGELKIQVVRGNRMSTVPKTTEKDRVICMEPELNMALQKALGCTLRRVYRKITGRDLNDTQEFHKSIVRDGLIEHRGHVYMPATIDLSAASDSISMLLCKEVLPPWIYDLVCSTRSPEFVSDNEWHLWNIVSSMGNGFTFELLSVITLLACEISGAKFYSTYGDDIICDADSAASVMSTLKHLGFTINESKTCVGIPQLESCGAFSFDGKDIPRYEFTWMENDHDVIVTLNKLFRLSIAYKDCDRLGPFTRDLWNQLYKLNQQHLPCGPNHDCTVDGRWVMLPDELYPTKKNALPSWAVKACEAYCVPLEDAWVLDALYFETDSKPVLKPRSPSAYCFVRHRLTAVPTVGIRGEGSWVRKKTFVGCSVVITRQTWNNRSKTERLGEIIPYPKTTGST